MADGTNIQSMNIVADADVSRAEKGLDSLAQSCNGVKQAVESVTGLSFGSFEDRLRKTYETARNFPTEMMSQNELKQGLIQAEKLLRSSELQMNSYADTQGQMFKNASIQYQDALGRIHNFRDALTSKTAPLQEKDLRFYGLNDQIEKATNGMYGLKAVHSGLISQFKDSGFKLKSPELATPITQITDYKNNIESFLRLSSDEQQKFMDGTKNFADNSVRSLSEVGAKAEETSGRFAGLRTAVADGLAQSQERVSAFAGRLSSFSNAVGTGADKMQTLISAVGTVGKNFLSAINPVRVFRDETKRLSLASTFLGKALARVGRMFRIMLTRMLIRAFITNIRDGFHNIAKYSNEVNKSFSELGASAKTMFNGIAVAITPIIQALTPYLTAFFDAITSGLNKVAELVRALMGKSTFIKATKYNYDYAKSIDNSTKATNKNSKATDKNKKKKKELKKATIGIDRLNVIEPKQTKDKSSNNNDNNSNVKTMFDTSPVSKKMKDLAKQIKKIAKKLFEPIQEAWNKKGDRVMRSFKSALGSIWETVKAIGRDFLTMWTQPETELIFEDAFDIVANLLDAVKEISDNFRRSWTKNNIGLKIFENIRDAFGVIVKRVKQSSEYTKEWAKRLNFDPLLESVERYTKSLKKLFKGISGIALDFYETVILGIYQGIVEKAIPKILDVFTDFNNKVDWKGLEKHLHNVWVGVKHFAGAIGKGLIDFIKDLSIGIRNIVNSHSFQRLLDNIGKLLKSLDSDLVKNFLKVWLGFKALKMVTKWFYGLAIVLAKAIGLIRWVINSKFITIIISGFRKLRVAMKTTAVTSVTTSTKLRGLVSVLGKVAVAIGVFVAVTKAYEVTIGDNGKKIHKSTEKTVGGIKKLTEKANELKSSFEETNDSIKSSEIAPYEQVKLYYDELKKITDENGKIKKGYKKQAEYYIQEINKQLGTSVSISGDYVKNLGSATKQLKKQQKLVTAKVGNRVLEEQGENYYKAKSGSKDAVSKYAKANKKWEYAIKHPEEYSEKEVEKLAKARYNAYKDYVKFKTVEIRYENLLKAVASGNRKEIEKAIVDMDKPIKTDLRPEFDKKVAVKTWKSYLKNTIGKVGLRFNNLQVAKDLPKAFKKALTEGIKKGKIDPQKAIDFTSTLAKAKYYGVKINDKLAENIQNGKIDIDTAIKYTKALANAKAKGKDVSKFIGDGVFKNKGSVQKAIDGLNKIIDTTAKKREAKVDAKKDNNLDEHIREINKRFKNGIPKEIIIKIRTRLDTASFTKAGKSAKTLSKIAKSGGTLKKQVRGTDGHTYAYYTDKNGKTRKRKLFANGGYPKLGSEFIAGEKGAEFVGNINGKTGVASNQEITGIRDSIESSSGVQNQILMEQNNLLRALLEKNTDIVLDGQKVTKRVNQINARSGYKMAT